MDGRTLVLGAPELFDTGPLAGFVARQSASAGAWSRSGRVPSPPRATATASPPCRRGLRCLAAVALAEELRPGAADTVAYLRSQGVRLRVLSGDAPATVAAVAADAGIPVSGPALDGRALPEDDDALLEALAGSGVIGRISPEEKRRVVRALARGGHYVAMIGDGVNDVPALKEARLAIAQGAARRWRARWPTWCSPAATSPSSRR